MKSATTTAPAAAASLTNEQADRAIEMILWLTKHEADDEAHAFAWKIRDKIVEAQRDGDDGISLSPSEKDEIVERLKMVQSSKYANARLKEETKRMLVEFGVQKAFIPADLALPVNAEGRSGKKFIPLRSLHLRSREPIVIEGYWEQGHGVKTEHEFFRRIDDGRWLLAGSAGAETVEEAASIFSEGWAEGNATLKKTSPLSEYLESRLPLRDRVRNAWRSRRER